MGSSIFSSAISVLLPELTDEHMARAVALAIRRPTRYGATESKLLVMLVVQCGSQCFV